MERCEAAAMKVDRKTRDPIPDHFDSAEQAAEFWDTHDLSSTVRRQKSAFGACKSNRISGGVFAAGKT
jgi:hypothetical protein